MSVTGDPVGDFSLVGAISAIAGGALARFGPQWIRALSKQDGVLGSQADVLHKRVGDIRDDLNAHKVEDAGFHGEIKTQVASLGDKVDAGFADLKALIQKREG